jgi:hypothetical protein
MMRVSWLEKTPTGAGSYPAAKEETPHNLIIDK